MSNDEVCTHSIKRPCTLRELKDWGILTLSGADLNITRNVLCLEAEVLLLESICIQNKTIKADRSYIYGHADDLLSDEIINQYVSMISDRSKGKPVAYILGKKEFYGYEYKVDRSTLIPRTETELLVQCSMKILGSMDILPSSDTEEELSEAIYLDIGTGSGCIILSVIQELCSANPNLTKNIQWIASDIQLGALAVARDNAQTFMSKVDVPDGFTSGFPFPVKLQFLQTSLLESFNFQTFLHRGEKDVPLILVSNPPYIDHGDTQVEPFVRKFEPETALFSEENGYLHLMRLVDTFISICSYWKSEVHLCVEIGFGQHNTLVSYFKKNAPMNSEVEQLDDAAGIPRVIHFFRRALTD